MKVIISLICLISFSAFSQKTKNNFELERELIRKILGGDKNFDLIEKEFERLMKEFHKGSFESFFRASGSSVLC